MRQGMPDDMLQQRLPIVIAGLLIASLVLLVRLVSFQFQMDPSVTGYLESVRNSGYQRTLRLAAARGNIYDRDLQALAVNSLEYRIGISPNLVSQPRETAIRWPASWGWTNWIPSTASPARSRGFCCRLAWTPKPGSR